jgi:hypothetical protein
MATWGDIIRERPDLAAAGQRLFYQFGVGLAFMATVDRRGRPRVHPMCPLLHADGLFAFIVPSPKQGDLRRDGLYSMHSFPCPQNEDAFYLSGRAELIDDQRLRDALSEQFVSERQRFPVVPPPSNDLLFHFEFDTCLLTRTTGHGDPSPRHEVWKPA